MVTSTEISSVDETLKSLLLKGISTDPTVKALILSPNQIAFCSPKQEAPRLIEQKQNPKLNM